MNRVLRRTTCCPLPGALALLCVCLLALPMVAQASDDAEPKASAKETKAGETGASEDSATTPPVSVYMQASARGREAAKSEARVFTNEDLEEGALTDKDPEGAYRLTGTPSSSDAPPPLSSLMDRTDPLEALESEQAAAEKRKARIADAERELRAARDKLANLEVQQLATRNPFSKRPQLSDEEKETRATSGETAAQRNERTNEMVVEAKADVAAAQKKLSAARGR